MRERIHYIDWVESLAIALVVCCHYVGDAGESVASNVVIQFTTTAAVPLFFMANGALLLPRQMILQKHLHKMLLLFVNVTVWKVLLLLLTLVRHTDYLSMLTAGELARYICGANMQSFYIPTEHFWYMYDLIGLYALFPLIKIAYDKSREVIKFITAFLFIMVFVFTEYDCIAKICFEPLFGPNTVYLGTLRSYVFPFAAGGSCLLFFLMGAFVGGHADELRARRRTLLAGACVAFALLLIEKYVQQCGLQGPWTRLQDDYQRVGTLVMSCCIFALFATGDYTHRLRANRFVQIISVRTMNIYVVHMALCMVINNHITALIPFKNIGLHVFKSLVVVLLSLAITEPLTYIPAISRMLGLKPDRFNRRAFKPVVIK